MKFRFAADVAHARFLYPIDIMDATPALLRLLIADDNAATRAATVALIEAGPHPVAIYEAANGQEAIQLAESVRPDVILMDVQMPLLDGITATRRIKQHWPTMRIVVLTMYRDHRKSALAAGADDFLLKGAATDALIATTFEKFYPRFSQGEKS